MVFLVAGAGFVAQRLLAKDDVFAAPELVELPALPKDTALNVAYLDGPVGTPLAKFVTAAAPILDDKADVSTCRTVIAGLDAIGTPDQIFLAASGVPDAATADMAVNHVAAVSRLLGACLEQGAIPSRDEVRFTSIVLDRRLTELR